MSESFEHFLQSPRPSSKHMGYFAVYDFLLSRYINTKFTFVEVGVLDGGSLFMWRDYFGANARIIGVDLNPDAAKWRDHGFEVFIGDQSNPRFWENFYASVGDIDVLLDDGGHTNLQQITTLVASLKNVKDGGLIIIEDTHTSYMREFGNPSKSSFNEFCKSIIDLIQARFPALEMKESTFSKTVWSIAFFESISAFFINRPLCTQNYSVSNQGALLGNAPNSDFRYHSDPKWLAFLRNLKKIAGLEYSTVGGKRRYLKVFNPILREKKIKFFFQSLLYPIKVFASTLINFEIRLRNLKLRLKIRRILKN